MSFIQLVSLAGAMTILAAFTLLQMGRWQSQERRYLVCNVLGAGTLTAVAWIERQCGFLLMEGVWTLVSLYGLLRPR